GSRELLREAIEHAAKRAEEARAHGLGRQRVADAQAECERRLVGTRPQALEQRQGAPRRPLSRDGRVAQGEASGGGAPAAQHEPSRGVAQDAREPAFGVRGESLRREAGGPLGVARGEAEDAERAVARDEGDGGYAGAGRRVAQPGPGWHGLPRRVVAE